MTDKPDKPNRRTWEEYYHEVGHYLASKGTSNELFSMYEMLAIEIRYLESSKLKLETRIAKLEENKPTMNDFLNESYENMLRHGKSEILVIHSDKWIEAQEKFTKLREALEYIKAVSSTETVITVARNVLEECFKDKSD